MTPNEEIQNWKDVVEGREIDELEVRACLHSLLEYVLLLEDAIRHNARVEMNHYVNAFNSK